MKFEQYEFKFYLNANHAIQINGKLGQIHPHTWEISIVAVKLSDNFVMFGQVENLIDKMIDRYQDKLLNEIQPFDTINPTLENICEVFKDKIRTMLVDSGWELLQIEVSETPARSYVINLSDDEDKKPVVVDSPKMVKQTGGRLTPEISDEVLGSPKTAERVSERTINKILDEVSDFPKTGKHASESMINKILYEVSASPEKGGPASERMISEILAEVENYR